MALRSSAPSHLRIETNSFDLATLAGTLPFLGSYRLTGNGQARVRLTFGNGPFSSDGSVSLKDASVAVVNGKVSGVSNLDATAHLHGRDRRLGAVDLLDGLGSCDASRRRELG
jgi:hypothetical protein